MNDAATLRWNLVNEALVSHYDLIDARRRVADQRKRLRFEIHAALFAGVPMEELAEDLSISVPELTELMEAGDR